MKYVYLVCSRSKKTSRVGSSAKCFTKSEIDKELEEFCSSNIPFYETQLHVLHCCSSEKKANELCDRFNGIDEYRFSQETFKGYQDTLCVQLVVYHYYIVKRVLI